MHFQLFNSRLASCAAVVKIFTMIFVPEDFLWMISMQKFGYIRQISFRIFESTRSIAEILLVGHTIIL
jgi:hypothetical protein